MYSIKLHLLNVLEETHSEILQFSCILFLHNKNLVVKIVDVLFYEVLHLLRVLDFGYLFLGDLQHLHDGGVDRLLANQEEEVHHLLAKVMRRIVVAHY